MSEAEVVNSDGGDSERLHRKCNPAPPDSASFSEDCLFAAEEAAELVLNCIRPTVDSERKRLGLVRYIQQLLKTRLDCQVFPYGSVPLKTYLPEGDIDFTALKGPDADDSLAKDVLAVLQMERQDINAEYQVRDTQFIDAEVKVVKCLIRNIEVDISFNQLGGLSKLCFLEQVSCIVGRNHLFKRSVILVKAWCFYESRILGSNHGLISTYALETLILYIFNMFHSSLSGPLSVLYTFLEYFSQFDWETYCISLKGPVCISSLPEVIVKSPENGWENLMLKEEFLKNCIEMFSVSLRGHERNPNFKAKHLNIIDPLKENNNIGRSVGKGSFYRIRSAFNRGARELGQILSRPKDNVADGVCGFFKSTLARHGYQLRSSIRHLSVKIGDMTVSVPYRVEVLPEDNMLTEPSVPNFDTASLKFEGFDPFADLCGDYATDVESLRHGQSFRWSTSSAPVVNNPPLLFVHPPEPPAQIQFSEMNSPAKPMVQNLYPSDSTLPANAASRSEGEQIHNARGTRSYFPRRAETFTSEGGRNGAPGNSNQFQRYARGYVGGRNYFGRNMSGDLEESLSGRANARG